MNDDIHWFGKMNAVFLLYSGVVRCLKGPSSSNAFKFFLYGIPCSIVIIFDWYTASMFKDRAKLSLYRAETGYMCFPY